MDCHIRFRQHFGRLNCTAQNSSSSDPNHQIFPRYANHNAMAVAQQDYKNRLHSQRNNNLLHNPDIVGQHRRSVQLQSHMSNSYNKKKQTNLMNNFHQDYIEERSKEKSDQENPYVIPMEEMGNNYS